MSAELENNKEEDTKEQPKNLKYVVRKYWQVGIKLLELLLCILCIGTAFDAVETMGIGGSDLHHIGFMYTAYTGYILITVTFLLNCWLRVAIPYRTCSLFSICGAGMFLTTGVLLLVDKTSYMRRYDSPATTIQQYMVVATATFSFINSIIFSIDACITFRRQEDF